MWWISVTSPIEVRKEGNDWNSEALHFARTAVSDHAEGEDGAKCMQILVHSPTMQLLTVN